MTTPRPSDDPAAGHSSTGPAPGAGRRALVTGATGYIGGRLVQPLLDAGWRVRVLTRDAQGIDKEPWSGAVEVATGDASQRVDVDAALRDVDVVYYLLHSMDGQGDFRERDRQLARTFASASAAAGVRRIVYLSGMHPKGDLSPHLASRVEVGDIFLASGVPSAVLQAAVVLGDGSASFDMLRFLTERLPVMVAPKWLTNRLQPIAVQDAVRYLVGAADLPEDVNRTFDIGGPDVLTYAEMIKRFANVTGLRPRLVATVPVLTPGLAGHWIGLVTPVSSGVAKPLVGSLVHEVVAHEHDIAQYIPDPPEGLTGFDDGVRAAMRGATPSTGPRNLAIAAGATVVAAAAGSWATTPDSRWYRSLDLPPWQPPPLAFPLVWTPLYASIAGTAASAVTTFEDRDAPEEARRYWAAVGLNLALNAGWSWAFWRSRRLPVASVWAGALAASSIDLARRSGAAGPVHRRALTPYAVWCSFATVLTTEIWRRNR